MPNTGNILESDLAWREAELASLKVLISSSKAGSVRQQGLLRASVAMLYAHYEGFCKFCWETYLDEVFKARPCPKDMEHNIKTFLLGKQINHAKNSNDRDFVSFLDIYETLRRSAVSKPPEIDTESNLWPEISQRINNNLNLSCSYAEIYSTELKALVGRRNDIAHGKKLIVGKYEDYLYKDSNHLTVAARG